MIKELLDAARNLGASDLHLVCGAVPKVRVNGVLQTLNNQLLLAEDTAQCLEEMGVADLRKEKDFTYCDAGRRFRVNAYLNQDTVALAIRLIPDDIPSLETLRLPEIVNKFAELRQGLVIVTGATGSGKSTTLAALVDRINALRYAHIVTLEDPIEYKHPNRQSLVTQREIGTDTESFATGLRAALRQDPDVIMLGEMRDMETMEVALNAAETGHLVLTTMHTGDATGALVRIMDTCGAKEELVRSQLASCIQGVIAQQLLPRVDGGRVAAYEVLVATPAVKNLIREKRLFQIPNYIQTGSLNGMQNMEMAILKLRRDGLLK